MNKLVSSYTLYELFKANIYPNTAKFIDIQTSFSGLDTFIHNMGVVELLPNIFALDESEHLELKDYVSELLQNICNRYQFNNFTKVEQIYCPWDSQIPSADSNEVEAQFEKDLMSLLQYMNMTYPKYAKILDLYEAKKTHLMDKLTSVVEAEAGTSGTSKYDDTPQTANGTYNDSYSTDVTKSSSSTESESTTTWDDANVMKRLDEIQKLYDNIMKRWTDNFEQFFWEVD